MLRRVVLALIAALFLATPVLADPELPALDAQGMTAPLRPDQLDAAERAIYAGLAPGSDEARQFLYTRGFLRYARRVVDGRLPAADLPPLPARANWNRDLLSPQDADIVDQALDRKTAPFVASIRPRDALTISSPALPGVDGNGRSLPLRPDQLYPEERSTFADLSGDDARRFLHTRGFLRYCWLVVDGKLPPTQLPKLPARADWDRGFFTQQEYDEIVQVALGMSLTARLAPK